MHGRMDDAVGGVEVAMSEVVPHPGDVAPRDMGFCGKDLGADVLDRLTDLDEADPNGIEDEPVVEATSSQMGQDRVG